MTPLYHPTFVIYFEDGHTESHDVRELVVRLTKDPELEGLTGDPRLVEMVVDCLVSFYRQTPETEPVTLANFIEKARELLVGFAEEKGFAPQLRSLQLDLLETARRPGCGFELEFFTELRGFLQQHLRSRTSPPHMRITGLRHCVKYLLGRRHWSRRCGSLQDEIVSVIRTEVARSGLADCRLAIF
ncbi:MAG: hypothetical protein PHV34_02930 [Verrucomicrobiae bacterium]|nr:hypothetical protein [Verrucomicrobiae bacterium]